MTAPVPSDDEIVTALRDIMAAVLSDEDLARTDLAGVTAETPLLSLPLDSVTLMAVIAEIEERFRVYIPEHRAFAFTRVGELVEYVGERARAKAGRAAR
ncbi:hypothetical protein GCM10009716_45970 [Streptomyces sodiiphilus]|uniref:Carrier domain-containing protein n=1 Tax=Streptomyces sodiiphilus TaxID=226217 RepID=A0ABN2PY13_9ACTN